METRQFSQKYRRRSPSTPAGAEAEADRAGPTQLAQRSRPPLSCRTRARSDSGIETPHLSQKTIPVSIAATPRGGIARTRQGSECNPSRRPVAAGAQGPCRGDGTRRWEPPANRRCQGAGAGRERVDPPVGNRPPESGPPESGPPESGPQNRAPESGRYAGGQVEGGRPSARRAGAPRSRGPARGRSACRAPAPRCSSWLPPRPVERPIRPPGEYDLGRTREAGGGRTRFKRNEVGRIALLPPSSPPTPPQEMAHNPPPSPTPPPPAPPPRLW